MKKTIIFDFCLEAYGRGDIECGNTSITSANYERHLQYYLSEGSTAVQNAGEIIIPHYRDIII